MLKYPITYTNFNGVEVRKDLYFNLTKTEIIDMVATGKVDPDDMIEKARQKDPKDLFVIMIDLILMSYGVKSEDGEHFDKSEDTVKNFKSSAAYDALISEITTDTDKALNFFNGLFSEKDLKEAMKQAESMNPPIQFPTSPLLEDSEMAKKIEEIEKLKKELAQMSPSQG